MAQIIEDAIKVQASDIFLMPKREGYLLSYRQIEGLREKERLSLKQGKELINFFKYAAQMDISEHRRPQVGAMTYSFEDAEYYLRFSSLGDFDDQESLVIRVIYKVNQSQYFLPDQLAELKELAKRRGLIISSGPTGSGKTTTMYELAKQIGQGKVVMTIEDPVEIHESSFLQAQVNNEAGIDYVSLLKAALRHRPDILIIGEIRDRGTARLAVDAALSGHLVFATVHAKSTLQTISRLEGLGITNDELANCLTAVSYQRLISSRQGLSCLLDVASKEILQKSISAKTRADFVSWQANLEELRKRGEIDDAAYLDFQAG